MRKYLRERARTVMRREGITSPNHKKLADNQKEMNTKSFFSLNWQRFAVMPIRPKRRKAS